MIFNWFIFKELKTIAQGDWSVCTKVEKPLIVNKEVKLVDPFDK